MFFVTNLTAQLKVNNNGFVGVGTNNPLYQLDIYDNFRVFHGGQVMLFVTNNPGTEIQSNYNEIAFWHNSTQFTKLICEQVITISDSTAKENILPVKNGLRTVLALNGYSYYLKEENRKNSEKRKQYGLIAQEVEKVIPSMIVKSKGYKLMNYSEFTPFLIEAIKEQQLQIDSLSNIVNILIEEASINYKKESPNRSYLFQNSPNPFTSSTVIKYSIPTDFRTARLIIYNLNGLELISYPITHEGKGEVIITNNTLDAGMYLYSLYIDNEILDTKKMVLTK